MSSFFILFSSYATIPLFTLLMQGGLDSWRWCWPPRCLRSLVIISLVTAADVDWTWSHEGGEATKVSKISCDYLFIYWRRVDWTWPTWRWCWPPRCLRSLVIIPLFTDAGVGWAWPTWRWFWPPSCLRSHVIIPYLLMQGGLDLTHLKVVLATKLSKISCDYPIIYWCRVDLTWPTWRWCWPSRRQRSHVIIPLFNEYWCRVD